MGLPCKRGLRTAIFGIRGLARGVLPGMNPQGTKGMRNDRRDWGNEEGQQGLKTSSCSSSCEQGMLMVMVVRDHSLTTIFKKQMGLAVV